MTYYQNLQNSSSMETLHIQELMRDRTRFSDWPLEQQKMLAAAIFPKQLRDHNGRWTVEGRAALNLLRHLIKNGHFLRVPQVLHDAYALITDEESVAIQTKANNVRNELVYLTPPWCLEALLS